MTDYIADYDRWLVWLDALASAIEVLDDIAVTDNKHLAKDLPLTILTHIGAIQDHVSALQEAEAEVKKALQSRYV